MLESLQALTVAVPALSFDEEKMAVAASDPRMLATDLAEYLVGKGMPFRESHESVATFLAAHEKVDAEGLRAFNERFGEDVAAILDAGAAVRRRNTPGGPAPEAVRAQLAKARDALGLEQYALSKHAESVHLVKDILTEETK